MVYCSPWGHKESDMTEQINNNDKGELDPAPTTTDPVYPKQRWKIPHATT